jgi:YggT family protein
MDALQEIAHLVIRTLFHLYIMIILLRFLLQVARADFYNPISQFLVKATMPVLKPFRRLIPGIGGVDVAAIVVVLLLQLLATTLLALAGGYSIPNPFLMLAWAAIGTLNMVCSIYFFSIIVSIVLSWVAPNTYNPIALLLNQLTEPVMAPLRRIIPPMGGLDLSPIFVFLLINVLQIILRNLAAGTGLPVGFVVGM